MDKRRKASISSRNLVDAVLRVERMSFTERERLVDEVHARQPNLFYSVLVLQRYGATLAQIEVVLNLLLVFHEAMKTSASTWSSASRKQRIDGQSETARMREWHAGEKENQPPCNDRCLAASREIGPAGIDPKRSEALS